MNDKITSKELLAKLHYNSDRRLSFNTFIERLRYNIALQHDYILSAVDYDSIVLDLIDLEVLDREVLYSIDFKNGDEC